MIDQNIRAHLARARGDNRGLANALCEKLSTEHKRQLLEVFRTMEQNTDDERRKRKSGQFWG